MPSLATAKLSIKTTYKDTLELSSSFFRGAAAMNRLISKDVVSQLQCVCYENIINIRTNSPWQHKNSTIVQSFMIVVTLS